VRIHRQSLKKSENQASDAPYTLGERNKPNNFIVATFFLNGITLIYACSDRVSAAKSHETIARFPD
jgi:hypothetical protein